MLERAGTRSILQHVCVDNFDGTCRQRNRYIRNQWGSNLDELQHTGGEKKK